jgi:hypothetical protein
MVRLLIFLAAATGLLLSLTVHGYAAASHETPAILTLASILERGAVATVALAVLSAMKGMEPDVATPTKPFLRAGAKASLIALAILIPYAIFNWVHIAAASREGEPVVIAPGLYALHRDNQILRTLPPSEYATRSAYRTRFNSANLATFFAAAALVSALPACRKES